MTNKSGKDNKKTQPTKGRPKILRPGKLNDQRNLICHKKSTTISFVQSSPASNRPTFIVAAPTQHVASAQPAAPTQPAALSQHATSTQPAVPTQPTALAQHAAPAQPATLTQSAASAQPLASAKLAARTHLTQSPIHASTPEVLIFMPTPGVGVQTMVGPSAHVSHETPIEEDVQQASHDEDEDEDEEVEENQEHVPPLVPSRDDNGKVIIQPYGKGLIPASEVAKAIGYAIRKQFYIPIHKWSVLDEEDFKDTKDLWFKYFGEMVSWDPRDHEFVKHVFEQKGAKRLTDMLTKARKKKTRPEWIGADAWIGLEARWKSEEFTKMSNQNKTNRASTRGGAVHTSGRKAHIDVALDLSANLQRDLRPDKLFLKTHKRKSGGWVDQRSEETYDTYNKKVALVQTQLSETCGEGAQEVDGGTILKLWTESAGGRTRGRVYGTGDLSVNLRRGCKSFTKNTQNSNGSRSETSLEAERAARVRAEQIAEKALAEAQKAKENSQKLDNDLKAQAEASQEQTQKLQNELNALRTLFTERFEAIEHRSAGGSCSANHSHAHPDYDDDLDDQSLDGHSS